nr:lectin BRA-3-like [Biomphalaria glabrata]
MELSHLTNSLIFIITYFLVVNKLVDCQLCQSGMTYHRHTHSCMIAVHSYLHYEEAKEYCARTYSGGHLVYILDKETDTFIKKNLIADQYWYYIGLSDKEENGVYKWINEKNVSYTGWYSKSHTPQRNKDYVVATVDGWIEVTDRSTKFICQSVAARSLSFSLNQQDFVNSTWDIVALTTNTFRCEVYDIDAHHLQLLYQNSDGTLSKIDDKLGKSLTYTFRPGFNSSGVYVCQIGQQHEGEIASLTGTLKVISKAAYCNEQDPNHNVIVDGNTDVTFHKFCVFVYPRPTVLAVYTAANEHVKESRYNASFTYIDEISARGEIDIRLYNMTSSDYGTYYFLFNNKYVSSRLYFNITGPAALPQDGDTNDMFYIIPIVAVVVLLVICVVIIVVVRKIKLNQKNKNTFNDLKDYRYHCGSETISAQQSSPSDVNSSANTFAPVCSSEVAENIYNNVLESQAHQGAKALKPARKSGSSIKLKEKVSIETGKRQASTLPLGKMLVTWDDDINVYENTPEDTPKQDQEHTNDKENKDTSSKEGEISNRELQMQEAKPSEDSRTVSPEGLIYVSVEINRSSKTPKLVEEKPKASDKLGKTQTKDENKTEIHQERKSSYDAVDYSSLDYLATSLAAIENSSGSLADTVANE